MLRYAVLAAVILFPFVPHAAASAAECEGAPDQVYHFDVRTEVPAARLDRSRTRASLNGNAIHALAPSTVGLMQSRLEMSHRTKTTTTPHRNGHCYWIQHIDVLLRFQSLDIFIASEYRRDSCAYRAILSHERDHVRVAREQLNRFAPKFRQALHSRDVPSPNNPGFTTGSPSTEIETIVAELIGPVFEELNATMAAAQAQLDTPQEYAKIQARCSDW